MSRIIAAGALAACAQLALAGAAAAQPAPAGPRHDISEICADGECVWEKVATCSGFLEGLNFDAEGRAWVVGLLAGAVMRVEGDGCVTVGETGGAPNGARFGPDGTLYVADNSGPLLAVAPDDGTRTVVHSGFGGQDFRGLNDLVFAAEGDLYFTEPAGTDMANPTGRVFMLPADGRVEPQVFAEGLAFPNGVALSPDGGQIYIGEFAANRILAASTRPGGFAITRVFATLEGGFGPDGMIVDADGNLYAAHFGAGEVVVIAPDGFAYGAIRLPEGAGAQVTNLALHDGWLYVVEAGRNEIWRTAVTTDPHEPFAGR